MSTISSPTSACDGSKAQAIRRTPYLYLRLPAVSSPDYLSYDRKTARPVDPMFVVRYRTGGGEWCERRMADHRVWKIIKPPDTVQGVTQLHPHAFCHSSAVELLRRSRNLRAVQAHVPHSDIQTTTVYTDIMQGEPQKIVNLFDEDGKNYLVAPTGHADLHNSSARFDCTVIIGSLGPSPCGGSQGPRTTPVTRGSQPRLDSSHASNKL